MNKTITIGNSKPLCALGQGTWFMGDNPARRAGEIQSLRKGIDLGMSVIDTAEMYGDGRSESLVGEAIRGKRDQVYLISKVLPSHASRQGTKAACEASLKRLGTDVIDLYLLHWQGRYPFSETVSAMIELVREGKIIDWGVSNMDVPEMEEFYDIPDGKTCAANEVLYNVSRRGIEFDLIPWCKKRSLPIIAYSPIEQGRVLESTVLRELGEKHGVTPAQIALAWLFRQDGIMAIPKAASINHVEENFEALSIPLTQDDLKVLDEQFPPPRGKVPLEML